MKSFVLIVNVNVTNDKDEYHLTASTLFIGTN